MKRVKKQSKKRTTQRLQKGADIWLLRKDFTGPRKYKTAKALWDKCREYFKYMEGTPLYEEKIAGSYKGAPMKVSIPKKRVYTLKSLWLYIGITSGCWYLWKNERPDLIPVMQFVEECIYNQKFEGAATGFFRENIIMRDLGLTDKKDITSGGKEINNSTSININTDVKEAEKSYKQILLG